MFSNNIYYTEDPILSKEFCNDLIDKFEKDPKKYPGVVGADASKSTLKKSIDLYLDSRSSYKNENTIFFNSLYNSLDEYGSLLERNSPSLKYVFRRSNSLISGFQMQRTLPGEYFHWHSDDLYDPPYYRALTYIFYLNDVLSGGQTEFNDGTIIQPKQGHCLIFPATWTYVHRGVSPTNETKYIVTGWWYTNTQVSCATL